MSGSNPARGDHCWGSWQTGSSEPRKDVKKGGRGQKKGAKENCLTGQICQACYPSPNHSRACSLSSPCGSFCPLPHTATHNAKALSSWPQSPSAVPTATAWDLDAGQWTGLETLCVAATPEECVFTLIFQEVGCRRWLTPKVPAGS